MYFDFTGKKPPRFHAEMISDKALQNKNNSENFDSISREFIEVYKDVLDMQDILQVRAACFGMNKPLNEFERQLSSVVFNACRKKRTNREYLLKVRGLIAQNNEEWLRKFDEAFS